MVTTVDGKIRTDNWPKFSVVYSLYEKIHNTFKADAWIVGRTTMEAFSSKKIKLGNADRTIKKSDFIGDPKAKKFAIVIDQHGKCRWNSNSLTGDHVIEILSEKVSTAYLRHLQDKKVSYIFAGKSKINLTVALKKLRQIFGIKILLLEGGGVVNGSFLKAGLIDELSQLIIPVIDGSMGTSTVFDVEQGYTSRKSTQLKLKVAKKMSGGIVWHRYQIGSK
jgi:riboflavin biosynthesis pyrimidine reductase